MTQIQCLIFITTYVPCLFDMNRANDQCIHVYSVTSSHRFAIELRGTILTHNWFLTRNISHTNASVILERNEKRLEGNEKRLKGNDPPRKKRDERW